MTTQLVPEQEVAVPEAPTRHTWRDVAPRVAAWIVGLLMPVLMLRVVLKASPMQWGDFWTSLSRFTNTDGSVHIRGFFTTQNHHPTFFPQMVYWLLMKVADGSNIITGLVDLVLAAITVGLLWALLPPSLSRPVRYTLTAVFSVLIFSLHGVFNFGFAMSGIAWFSANIAVLAAIWCAQRSLTVWAVFFCAAASCCYGTGYLSWLCVILIAFIRTEPWWRRVLPIIGFIITVSLAASGYESLPVGGLPKPDISTQLGVVLSFLGALASGSDSTLPIVIGAGILTLTGFCVYLAFRSRQHLAELTPWIAVAAYGIGSGALVSQARDVLGSSTGTSSRYTSLTALLWCSVVVMGVTLWARERLDRVITVAGALLLVTTATASTFTQSMANDYVPQEALKAISLRLDISGSVPSIPIDLAGVPSAKANKLYPFNDDFNVGCGQWTLGTTVPKGEIQALQGTKTVGGTTADTVSHEGRVISGYAVVQDNDPECVMVVDKSSKVVGGGIVNVPFPSINGKVLHFRGQGGFTAVVPVKAGATTVLVVGQGHIWSVPGLPPAS